MVQWTIYHRPGCSLCDEMMAELAQLLDPQEAARVQVVDVSADPDLERKYGKRIPVLLADGDFVCNYRLDAERVSRYRT
ncbi:MAG TPA: glutaredoxin family protein [Steroidobacteraceae bacterium]|nr:glutaredoxin family protein [Steroidobacteraceae bacterium]